MRLQESISKERNKMKESELRRMEMNGMYRNMLILFIFVFGILISVMVLNFFLTQTAPVRSKTGVMEDIDIKEQGTLFKSIVYQVKFEDGSVHIFNDIPDNLKEGQFVKIEYKQPTESPVKDVVSVEIFQNEDSYINSE